MNLRPYPRRAAALALALSAALAVLPQPVASAQTNAGAAAAASATGAAAVLVLNKADNTLSFVDPETLKVSARVAVGEGPHEVVVSADGRTAYVSNYGTQQVVGSSISIIDIAARKELRRVDLGALRRPHGLAVAGGKLYFTSETSRSVGRLDPATDKVDWVMGTGASVSHMLVVTPDNRRAYVTLGALNGVASVDLETLKVIARGETGQGPDGIAYAPGPARAGGAGGE
ncbi:MAG: YncE family protein [Acidobacteria bacterium]|nr:YncE family protein [Acidobacteriota bacterium]